MSSSIPFPTGQSPSTRTVALPALVAAGLCLAAIPSLPPRAALPFADVPLADGTRPGAATVPIAPEAIALLRDAMLKAAGAPAPAASRAADAEPALTDDPIPAVPPVTYAALPPDPGPAAPSASGAAPTSAPRPILVPMPVPRPSDLVREGVPETPAPPTRRRRRAPAVAAAPQPPAEEPSFFDRLFGIKPEQKPVAALAYADGGTGAADGLWRGRVTAVPTPAPAPVPAVPPIGSGGTAVYDISARTVTLPDGTVLEAHSGLGPHMDDPSQVHLTMRGPTPPGTYDLTERESLFHGVRALRLTPVGGGPAAHGRVGLLAHTYMLRRQPGASNGCVVFADYERFLQAYLRGQIRRLVVVAGRSEVARGR